MQARQTSAANSQLTNKFDKPSSEDRSSVLSQRQRVQTAGQKVNRMTYGVVSSRPVTSSASN